jgi:hypothetical protein
MVSFVNLRVLCGLRFGNAIVDDRVRTLTAKKDPLEDAEDGQSARDFHLESRGVCFTPRATGTL